MKLLREKGKVQEMSPSALQCKRWGKGKDSAKETEKEQPVREEKNQECVEFLGGKGKTVSLGRGKIGRASCRERV